MLEVLARNRAYALGVAVVAAIGLVAAMTWAPMGAEPLDRRSVVFDLAFASGVSICFGASSLWLLTEVFGPLGRMRSRFSRALAFFSMCVSLLVSLGLAAGVALTAYSQLSN